MSETTNAKTSRNLQLPKTFISARETTEESGSDECNETDSDDESTRSSIKEREKDEDLSVTKEETPFVELMQFSIRNYLPCITA